MIRFIVENATFISIKIAGLGNRDSATRKPQGKEPYTIFKISCKSIPDPNMAIPLLKKILGIQTGLDVRLSPDWLAAAKS